MYDLDEFFKNSSKIVTIESDVYFDKPCANGLIYPKEILLPELERIRKYNKCISIMDRNVLGRITRFVTPITEVLGRAEDFEICEKTKTIYIKCRFVNDGLTNFVEGLKEYLWLSLYGVGKYKDDNKNILKAFSLNKFIIDAKRRSK